MLNKALIVGIVIIILILIVVFPLLVIWSLNVLFGLAITYTLKTWFAALVLAGTVYGSSVSYKAMEE